MKNQGGTVAELRPGLILNGDAAGRRLAIPNYQSLERSRVLSIQG